MILNLGTHCAGTIGAIGGNQAGVVGVNPDPARFSFHIGKGLSDSGSGSGSDVVNAVKDCVDNGAHVISMSLGCSNCYVQAYDEVSARGTFLEERKVRAVH